MTQGQATSFGAPSAPERQRTLQAGDAAFVDLNGLRPMVDWRA